MTDEKSHWEDSTPVALVTGGAVRIGRAVALALAEAGYDLVVGYRSSAQEARETKRSIEELGRSCVLVKADLSDAAAVDALVDAARQRFGRLDVVVNSASSFRSVPLTEVDADEWDAVMAVNVRAPHLVVRAAADLLRDSAGSVVNMVDLSAFQAWTQYPHHAVSKAALAHLTRVQARALAPRVRVNAIAPGAVLAPDGWPAEQWEKVARRAVLRRTGSPDDVVNALLYLIRAEFVTGHVLPVDGGRLLGPTGPITDE
ncbi:MAG: SDR family oxidoreductase [Gemmatimonadota bacterium]|nr:SDR family oxidoreductase [Gemmatimonadota bacterium]